jgi:hypothetical protein
MDRIKVQSSNIASIGYEKTNKILEVEFLSRSVYHYFDVPFSIYEGLMSAPSHGEFLNSIIKHRFNYKQIQ